MLAGLVCPLRTGLGEPWSIFARDIGRSSLRAFSRGYIYMSVQSPEVMPEVTDLYRRPLKTTSFRTETAFSTRVAVSCSLGDMHVACAWAVAIAVAPLRYMRMRPSNS